jgi:hypothetical protein
MQSMSCANYGADEGEGVSLKSHGMQVMYALQILQSYVPTESLAKAQKIMQTMCC